MGDKLVMGAYHGSMISYAGSGEEMSDVRCMVAAHVTACQKDRKEGANDALLDM